MVEARDDLERDLDRIGAHGLGPAPAPPAMFLKAVGRRRTQRRVRQAGALLTVAALLVVMAVVVRSPALKGGPGLTRPEVARAGSTQPVAVTIGSVAATIERERRAREPAGRGLPAPVIHAADWRSETKLASLVGAS